MYTSIRLLAFMTAFVPVILFHGTLKAQAKHPLNGTWNCTVETSMGNGTPVFELNHTKDDEVTGTYRGALGEAPVKGSLKGKEVVLRFEANGQTVEYTGTLDGNTIKGKVKLGTMAEGTFIATKKTPSVDGVSEGPKSMSLPLPLLVEQFPLLYPVRSN
jgi:hypothetical protein